MTTYLEKLEAEIKHLRDMGDSLDASAKEFRERSRQSGLTEQERMFCVVMYGARDTLAIVYHGAARDIEDELARFKS